MSEGFYVGRSGNDVTDVCSVDIILWYNAETKSHILIYEILEIPKI